MGYFRAVKIQEPLSIKVDIDNVGLAKDSSIVGNLGKYDFVGWLLSNGTVKYIWTWVSAGSSKIIYTVPSGKTAYLLFALAFKNIYVSNTDTMQWCNLRIRDESDTDKCIICYHSVYVDPNGIPHIIYLSNISFNIIKLHEGWYLQLISSSPGGDGVAHIMLVEI